MTTYSPATDIQTPLFSKSAKTKSAKSLGSTAKSAKAASYKSEEESRPSGKADKSSKGGSVKGKANKSAKDSKENGNHAFASLRTEDHGRANGAVGRRSSISSSGRCGLVVVSGLFLVWMNSLR